MIREVDIKEISDGKLYHSNDMVKIMCNDCKGCSDCCHGMGESIVLDPYDIFMLTKATSKKFEELLKDGYIELNVVDGVILPNIKMNINNKCSFLNNEQRCSIHSARPGFCRLFPLGRIYNDDGFDYFIQINECSYPIKSKIKIKKWIGIDDLSTYDSYIKENHILFKNLCDKINNEKNDDIIKEINMTYLNLFYIKDYDMQLNFYKQYSDRNVMFTKGLI